MANRRLFVRFTKIDEEKREVWGRLTQEVVDRDGEIWDYDSSVPHMREWSDSFKTATDGKSLGNLRAMHHPISAGKLIAIDFNDADKAVDIGTKIVDDAEWNKVEEGLYTGFSVGGRVVRSWRDAADPKFKRFEIRPVEASLADMPCVPTATFDYIKVGGLVETRHFNKIKEPSMKPTKFADAANKKFPIETKAQTRVSLAVWGKTKARETYSADAQALIVGALVTAATEHGLEGVTAKAIDAGEYAKGLYDVSRLAEAISTLAWLQQCAASERDYEGDDSTVPDEMTASIAALLSTLETMVGEEGDELLRILGLDVAAASAAAATPETKKVETPEVVEPTKSDASAPEAAATPEKVEAAAAAPVEADTPVEGGGTNEKVALPESTKGLSKKHVAALQELHDSAKVFHKMVSDHCEKLAGMIDAATATEDGSDKLVSSSASASSEFEKVTGERDDWQKRAIEAERVRDEAVAGKDAAEKIATELAETGKTLAAALEKRKGNLLAVSREADGITPLAGDKVEKVDKVDTTAGAPGEVDRDQLHTTLKTAFARPIEVRR